MQHTMNHDSMDAWLCLADRALRTLSLAAQAQRPYPAKRADAQADETVLSDKERSLSAALMRVNHAGEVCAQALYEAHALGTGNAQLRQMFLAAADEERDHLAWTAQRIEELGGSTSKLAALWYAGSLAIGLAVSRLGDAVSLGFMAETERQVEAHLDGHLTRLPGGDEASKAVVAQMKADEAQHRQAAMDHGAATIAPLGRTMMRLAAKVMTTVAHRI